MTDWYKYNNLNPSDKFQLTTKKTDLEIVVFNCDHSIPTISYGLSELKQKLKPEYSGLAGKEIAKLRSDGVEITTEIQYKRLAYICDTSIAVFELNPDILNYAVIFIECTFLMPDELENAIVTKHIHWDQLKPYVLNHPDKIFMLFHFSQRYRDTQINEFFQRQVENGIKNLHWW